MIGYLYAARRDIARAHLWRAREAALSACFRALATRLALACALLYRALIRLIAADCECVCFGIVYPPRPEDSSAASGAQLPDPLRVTGRTEPRVQAPADEKIVIGVRPECALL